MTATVGAVVIGRNEGKRLLRCLDSLSAQADRIVYVDSGSTDESREAARGGGAGFARLIVGEAPTAIPDYVQFVDGDCEVHECWIATGRAFLDDRPDVAVVCGRRRERHPDASLWNRLIDSEWNTPIGPAKACGGDALMRAEAVEAVGGFDARLIAGEEPELCVRLRQAGWKIWRLDAEMTLHDAAMTRFGQWWQRSRRAGHAYAEGAAIHGAPPEFHKVAETRRALLWGAGIPFAALAAGVASPWGLLILLAWPLQVLRLILRGLPPVEAFFLTLAKVPEALGVFSYWKGRVTRRRSRLIEYK
jgi:GT2 family glycosyltransferase